MPLSRAQVKAVKKIAMTSSELKKKELVVAESSLGSNFTVSIGGLGTSFSLAQGTDEDERIGETIKVKDLQFNLHISPGSTAGNQDPYRVIVYQLLDSNNSAIELDPFEFWPDSNQDQKYKILYDKITNNTDNTNRESQFHRIRISGKSLKLVKFDDASTTCQEGQVAMTIVPLNTTANVLNKQVSARIRYYDL